MKHDVDGYLPLAPATLHILIALAGEDLHGYGIMQEVARQSEGRYKIGPGTLYDNLQRLTAQGVVMDVDPGPQQDSRRRYYRLTSLGRAILSAEINRLEAVVVHAKLQLQPAKPRRS
jgi:DNA-binding PadR family transcriptional regulator